jgi:hypothetical protein
MVDGEKSVISVSLLYEIFLRVYRKIQKRERKLLFSPKEGYTSNQVKNYEK